MSDYSDDSDVDIDATEYGQQNQEFKEMTTDGIPENKTYHVTNNLHKYKLCEVCNKYYGDELINDSDKDFIKCTHCFYYFKYNDFQKGGVTDDDVKSLLNYFELCKDDHDPSKCTKNSDSGGCILCEFKIGMVPLCVEKYTKKLEGEKKMKKANNEVFISGDISTKFKNLDILSKKGGNSKIRLQL